MILNLISNPSLIQRFIDFDIRISDLLEAADGNLCVGETGS